VHLRCTIQRITKKPRHDWVNSPMRSNSWFMNHALRHAPPGSLGASQPTPNPEDGMAGELHKQDSQGSMRAMARWPKANRTTKEGSELSLRTRKLRTGSELDPREETQITGP
jgi:hypothetical protein